MLNFFKRILDRWFRRPKKFLVVLREFMAEQHVKKQHTEETIKKYEFMYRKIARYVNSKHPRLTVNEVRIPIFEEYRMWLHSRDGTKHCSLSHSSRHLEMAKGAMKYAVKKEYIKYNPLAELETGRDRTKKIVYLEPDELDSFIQYNFQNSGYLKAQVLYTFSCATGISYGNLFDYQTKIDAETGGLWIEDNRKKVGKTPFYVPLDAPGFEIARFIHEIYDGKLPQLANGCYNRYLKEMAAILKINKQLTTHTARKTFATLMDQEGYSITVIAAILGNSERVCRDHYVSHSRKKIERAIAERSKLKQAA